MRDIKEVKKEADQLGIEYPKNITVAKLEEKIEEAKKELTVEKAEEIKPLTERERMAIKRKSATERYFVNITSNDPRDDEDETAFVGFGNKYFELARLVPLGQDVWLEKALIDILKDTKIIKHIQETDRLGKPTGNKKAKLVNKYNISYPKGPDITYTEFKKQNKK